MPGCPTCGTARDSWQKLRVHHRSAHGESLPNRECERCGERFYCGHPRKYCSEECRYESREIDHSGANNPNYSGAKETTECEQCGDAFDYYPSEKAGRLCSDCVDATEWQDPPALAGAANPNYDGGKLRLVCDVCERRFERYPSNVGDGATLCSNECRAAWLSDEYAGSGHPNWNGGPTGSYGPGWRQVRERALERDGYACVLCGADSDDLAITPEEIDIDNYEGRNLSPPDLLYRDDVDAILSQTRDLRDRALFALMLATGQRLDAVRTLRIKHVEADGRTMTVRLNDTEGALKGASGTVPLLWSKHYVRSWYDSHPFQDDPDAALFPPAKGAVAEEERQDPVNSDAVTKAIGRMADRAGIEKRVYPHLLRASAITRMAAKGVSEQRIKQIAGWSRDSSQFSTYVALADDINNDAAREELGYATSDQDPPVIGRPTLEACPNTGCGDPIPEGRDVCPTCGFDLSAPTDTEEPDPDADAVITAEEHGRHDAELLTDFAQSLGAWMKHEAEADDGADPLEMADAMTRITPDEVEQLMNNE